MTAKGVSVNAKNRRGIQMNETRAVRQTRARLTSKRKRKIDRQIDR